MRLVTKIYPFIHKTYTLCVLYVLRGEFLQWTQWFNVPSSVLHERFQT
jgi:hypothetical protein